MIKFILDTNICIYIIKQKPENVIERFRQTSISDIGVSSTTLSELEYGVMKSAKPEQNKLALAQFLAPIEISAYDDVAAQHYGKICAHLQRNFSCNSMTGQFTHPLLNPPSFQGLSHRGRREGGIKGEGDLDRKAINPQPLKPVSLQPSANPCHLL